MRKTAYPYQPFDNFVLRTPLFDFDFYKELVSEDILSRDQLIAVITDPIIKEALFLASPSFYSETEKWINGNLDSRKSQRIQLSLLKYLTRMSTRCTPFGLFAGCGLGKIDKETQILGASPETNARHTRLDMNYLVALSLDLAKKKKVKENLLFFPNSSIYITGPRLRYVEYYYIESKRQHHIVEVDNSTYLQKIITKATSGVTVHDLVKLLKEDDIPEDDAIDFIEELLENQLLVSELEPSVSGKEFTLQILEVLKRKKGIENEFKFLTSLKEQLNTIDKSLGNAPETYIAISEELKAHTTTFELKYLFQTDMEIRPKENKLSIRVVEAIQKGMALLNRITPRATENNLSKFRKAFVERYEEREMPLSKILDVETGIGYIQDRDSGDINPLVDDIILPARVDAYNRISVNQNSVHKVLEEKLISCDKQENKKIVLTNDDFKDFPLNWDDLPDTLSVMVQIINEGEGEKIRFSGTGGSSAANLLGRFCHGDAGLNKHTQNIVDLEQQMNTDKVLAEIVHLPEARVGNILMRPSFRKYEIPYLAKSSLGIEHQIPLDDLFISVRRDRIFLRSKRLNKEVIPHLTNAHNFSANALPIYQFLCDMQTQNMRGGFFFNFGFLSNNRGFLPRVEYENLILSEAKWKIKKRSIQVLLSVFNDIDGLKTEVEKWCNELSLPQYVLLSDGDNQLLINFKNMTSVQMLLDTVKNRSEFLLSEFLFAENGVVKSKNGHYTHQIVVSFFNNDKLKSQNKGKNE